MTVPELELVVLPVLPVEFVVDFVVDFVSDPVLPEFPLEFALPELFLEEFPKLLLEELLAEFLFPPPGLLCPPRPGPP